MRRFLKNLFRRHLGWKLLSLALATGIWVLVSSEPELAAFVTVPVQYKHLSEDLEISSNFIESVSLELRGPSGDLRDFSAQPSAVVLDMAGVHPGERTFLVSQSNVDLPRGVRLIRAVPAQLHLEFERRSSRAVPVKARFSKNPPPGYIVSGYEATPDSLVIVGPERRVAATREVLTDPVDLSLVTGDAAFRVNAFVPDPHVRFQSDPRVHLKVSISKR